MRFDLDPTLPKVIIIAFLLFAVNILTPLIAMNQLSGEFPTISQIYTILLNAFLSLVIFMLAFVKTGTLPEEKP